MRARAPLLLLALYTLLLLLLLRQVPLWLDELVDIVQIRQFDLPQLMAAVPLNAGGVPLSYLLRWPLLHTSLNLEWAARLPSAAASLAACVGFARLASMLGLRAPVLAAVAFALLPVQLRYALESRPYVLGLAIVIWSTTVFLGLRDHPGLGRALLYTSLITAGLYTQPYTIFGFIPHLLAVRSRRVLAWTAASTLLASLLFLPWHLLALHTWQSTGQAAQQFGIGWHAIPLLTREFTGAGYLGTALLLGLVMLGWRYVRERAWLAAIFLSCFLLPPATDAYFGYFLAARQVIYAVVPLTIFAAAGLEHLPRGFTPGVLVLFAAFDTHFLFWKRHEDWRTAATSLATWQTRGACVQYVPENSKSFYLLFRPELGREHCPSATVVLASSPYESDRPLAAAEALLSRSGFVQDRTEGWRPALAIYHRSSH